MYNTESSIGQHWFLVSRLRIGVDQYVVWIKSIIVKPTDEWMILSDIPNYDRLRNAINIIEFVIIIKSLSQRHLVIFII